MDFLISSASAQAPASGQQSSMSFFILMIGMVAFMYFVLIRPQSKRAKEHKAMVQALAKGDEIVTTGGILGKVKKLDEQFISLEVSAGVTMKVQRHAVGAVLPKGTIKD